MCSILGILEIQPQILKDMRKKALKLSSNMRHRGPDWSGIYTTDDAVFVHERLSIVGIESGAQPIVSEDERYILVVNGEIYNYRELKGELNKNYNFQTDSDCEVIIPLLIKYGVDGIKKLNGIFGFIFYDKKDNSYIVARDHIGIIPLYQGYDTMGHHFISSEMKGLYNECNNISIFPPGSYYSSQSKKIKKYYTPNWENFKNVTNLKTDKILLKNSFEKAVHDQLMSDVPYGVLLSGGLDSSIVSAIVKKFSQKRVETDDQKIAWWPNLHSFSIGLKGAPDLKAAKEVADFIGTIHHEFNFTVQEGIDSLSDVIYHLETYDLTTVRASVPMYLLARKIKSMGIKMVLSGEGADEIFGGYLYFHKAPNSEEFHNETVRKLSKLHLYDCLRANKSMAAWGIEARVPFLDKNFLDIAMSINPKDKMVEKGGLEKKILRDIFSNYLPQSIISRQKEQFSDGVGYSWIDSLKKYAEDEVSDIELKNAHFKFPINTPITKEGYLYRSIFSTHFSSDEAIKTVPFEESIACSTKEAIKWDENFKNMTDPSGRSVISIHNSK